MEQGARTADRSRLYLVGGEDPAGEVAVDPAAPVAQPPEAVAVQDRAEARPNRRNRPSVVPDEPGLHRVTYSNGAIHYWRVPEDGPKTHLNREAYEAATEQAKAAESKQAPSSILSRSPLVIEFSGPAAEKPRTQSPKQLAAIGAVPTKAVVLPPAETGPRHRAEHVTLKKRYLGGLALIRGFKSDKHATRIETHTAGGYKIDRREQNRRVAAAAVVGALAGATLVLFGFQLYENNGSDNGGGLQEMSPPQSAPYKVMPGTQLLPKHQAPTAHKPQSNQTEHPGYKIIRLKAGDTIWGREAARHPHLNDTQIHKRVSRDLRANHISWAAAHYLQIGQQIKLVVGK